MTKKRLIGWIAIWMCTMMGLAILLPGLIVQRGGGEAADGWLVLEPTPLKTEGQQTVAVQLSATHAIETVPLETYVRGVVAAEMPMTFELEALKAQAVAARTYIVRRMTKGDYSDMSLPGAMVTDSVQHQAYISEAALAKKWSWFDRGRNLDKLNRAINETAGLVATYQGEPIQAVFFSTSNGYTENSEEYWSEPVPYLRSVASPWDVEQSPKYKETMTLSAAEIAKQLGLPDAQTVMADGGGDVQVLSQTTGHRIESIRIAGQTFSGREVREKLGLRSSHFDWTWRNGKAVITTYGYGHGVGMSQYGANGMAREGKRAEDILRYYYQGIEITPWRLSDTFATNL